MNIPFTQFCRVFNFSRSIVWWHLWCVVAALCLGEYFSMTMLQQDPVSYWMRRGRLAVQLPMNLDSFRYADLIFNRLIWFVAMNISLFFAYTNHSYMRVESVTYAFKHPKWFRCSINFVTPVLRYSFRAYVQSLLNRSESRRSLYALEKLKHGSVWKTPITVNSKSICAQSVRMDFQNCNR